jgi:Uma2 family endonuclease
MKEAKKKPMSLDDLDLNKRYTYADYLSWTFDETVELIRGKIFRMSPAPGRGHQKISMNLSRLVSNYLLGKKCEVFAAPFDVRLPLPPEKRKDGQIDTVVQPDLCVICDTSKLDDKGCLGAPDWIIEILSKSTASKDLNEKFELYEFAGVKEYWVVHPHEGTLLIYRLKDGKYVGFQKPFTKGDVVDSVVFSDLNMDVEEIFE